MSSFTYTGVAVHANQNAMLEAYFKGIAFTMLNVPNMLGYPSYIRGVNVNY